MQICLGNNNNKIVIFFSQTKIEIKQNANKRWYYSSQCNRLFRMLFRCVWACMCLNHMFFGNRFFLSLFLNTYKYMEMKWKRNNLEWEFLRFKDISQHLSLKERGNYICIWVHFCSVYVAVVEICVTPMDLRMKWDSWDFFFFVGKDVAIFRWKSQYDPTPLCTHAIRCILALRFTLVIRRHIIIIIMIIYCRWGQQIFCVVLP